MLPKRCNFSVMITENSVVKPFVQPLALLPLAIVIFPPDTCGAYVYLSVHNLLFYTYDTQIFCENSYHKQYHSDISAY